MNTYRIKQVGEIYYIEVLWIKKKPYASLKKYDSAEILIWRIAGSDGTPAKPSGLSDLLSKHNPIAGPWLSPEQAAQKIKDWHKSQTINYITLDGEVYSDDEVYENQNPKDE